MVPIGEVSVFKGTFKPRMLKVNGAFIWPGENDDV